MATTRIWSISGRLDYVINYVQNPEKTDGAKYTSSELQALQDVIDYAENPSKTEERLYVTGINVSPDIARDQMVMTKQQYGKTDKILAYHGYQSFLPGEVTPDLAHEIGVELAKRLWGDRFQVLVTTHLDKNHLHNHFCLNSVSFTDGYKFRGGIKEYKQMRETSDKLCQEYGLSVIENPQKGKSYAEWKAEQEGKPTIRSLVKDELDEIIKSSCTYQQFLAILKHRGYEIKRDVKHTAIKPPCSKRYIRLKSLGERYSEEAIRNRIMMAWNGISEFSEIKDHNAWAKKYAPPKLKGFKALYFHYLYLFGRIHKKETPQRVSFYMREELTKLDRYQKQFRFMYDNNIETEEQLKAYKESAESEIEQLTEHRTKLYNTPDSASEITDINAKLRNLRKEVRLCNNILEDSKRIKERYETAIQLEQEAKEKKKPRKRFMDKER